MKIILSICLLGLFSSCSTTKEETERIIIEFRIAEVDPAPGLTELMVRNINENFYLRDEVLLNNIFVV
jgi:hypothetical protein